MLFSSYIAHLRRRGRAAAGPCMYHVPVASLHHGHPTQQARSEQGDKSGAESEVEVGRRMGGLNALSSLQSTKCLNRITSIPTRIMSNFNSTPAAVYFTPSVRVSPLSALYTRRERPAFALPWQISKPGGAGAGRDRPRERQKGSVEGGEREGSARTESIIHNRGTACCLSITAAGLGCTLVGGVGRLTSREGTG